VQVHTCEDVPDISSAPGAAGAAAAGASPPADSVAGQPKCDQTIPCQVKQVEPFPSQHKGKEG